MSVRIKHASLVVLCLMPALAWGDCQCKEPALPELPPEKPTAVEMGRTSAEVSAFAEAMKGYRECLVKCVRSAELDMNHIVSDWNEMVEQFNRGLKETK